MECADAGIDVLLFDWRSGYPWSTTGDEGPHHERIERVSSWDAVEETLLARVRAAERAAGGTGAV